jgi:2-C-methyl-D-erythritol 2,4-cyclodiphosphate synthase
MIKIGQSIDIHQLRKGRDLIIGGVKIPFEKGLYGHSDADVLLHAIIEAIIGALGLGDIGKHFPDTNKEYEGISSLILLEYTYELLTKEGYKIGNIDSIILAENPKMAPYIHEMRENIAERLKTNIRNINIKATRGEKMGFIGNEEGMIAQVVVVIMKK